jgi:excisionase family DNA binding protein
VTAPRPRPVRFLTAKEVARHLRVSPMTVYREINDGRLGAVRVGRSIRIPTRALDDYIRDQEVGFDGWLGA